MLRVFQTDIAGPGQFVITLELVPGKESIGRSVDTVMGIAKDSFSDGRVSAVSITDNPGGNPSLSPDVIGHDIFKVGMDVIVHFTCRDLNRVGMESRALQLAMMGMKNLLCLTGDYTGKGFGGQGAPVFDLDSVSLQLMLSQLNGRLQAAGDPDGFYSGCAVSPFKWSEAETFAQYAKLCRKIASGAQFVITQLGYDARKFNELIGILNQVGLDVPVLGSVYVLSPRAARAMNRGFVPGAVVSNKLLQEIETEWTDPEYGRQRAVERAARLGAILKGLGYRGMHLGGIHHDFKLVGRILDRFRAIEADWKRFLPKFDYPKANGFYVFPEAGAPAEELTGFRHRHDLAFSEKLRYHLLKFIHDRFFSFDASGADVFYRLSHWADALPAARKTIHFLEGGAKKILLRCKQCGDCGIQHLAFLCPESQCPKHIRNGACGGSRYGRCEVYPERYCVWVRAYHRLASTGEVDKMVVGCVPPRMWELNDTPSWLNFHLKRDHQSVSTDLTQRCSREACRLAEGKLTG